MLPVWRSIQPVMPIELPSVTMLSLNEPGFAADESGVSLAAVNCSVMKGGDALFFDGVSGSEFTARGPRLVNRRGIGVGAGVLLGTNLPIPDIVGAAIAYIYTLVYITIL